MMRQSLSCPHPTLAVVLLPAAAQARDLQPPLADSDAVKSFTSFPTATPAQSPAPPLNAVCIQPFGYLLEKTGPPRANEVKTWHCDLCEAG